MLVDAFLAALDTYHEAQRSLQNPQMDEIQCELAKRNLEHAKQGVQDALDDYVATRVEQRLLSGGLTGTPFHLTAHPAH